MGAPLANRLRMILESFRTKIWYGLVMGMVQRFLVIDIKAPKKWDCNQISQENQPPSRKIYSKQTIYTLFWDYRSSWFGNSFAKKEWMF